VTDLLEHGASCSDAVASEVEGAAREGRRRRCGDLGFTAGEMEVEDG
jgi:hypothetical protein